MRDAALLIFRLVIGVVFVAHGYNNIFLAGMAEAAGQFAAEGVLRPDLVAWGVSVLILVGGAVLIIGLLTAYVAGLLALITAAGAYFLQIGHGFFAAAGGFEYALVLVAALLMIIVFGPGRASVDGILTRA